MGGLLNFQNNTNNFFKVTQAGHLKLTIQNNFQATCILTIFCFQCYYNIVVTIQITTEFSISISTSIIFWITHLKA